MNNLKLLLFSVFLLPITLVFGQTIPCVGSQSFRIVVLGSSTAAGAGVSHPDSAWVNRFRNYLHAINPNNEVINLAMGGYNTYKIMPSGFVPPVNRPLADTVRNVTKAISLNPDAIIVNMPSNDVASGYSVAEQLFNLDSIFNLSNQNNIPIWICTTQPRNFSVVQRQLQEDLKDSINLRYSPFVIDFWTTIALVDNSINPVYNSGDGVHLNDAGHALLLSRVQDADLLNYLYTPPSFSDYTARDISVVMASACGEMNTDFNVEIANIGTYDSTTTTVFFSLQNLTSGSQQLDTLVLPSGLPECTADTVLFVASTFVEGNYLATATISNANDTIPVNDTVAFAFQTIGNPVLNPISDTLCEPGIATLFAGHEANDTVFWYNSLTDTVAMGNGSVFTTPVIDSTSVYYAQTIRGNLYYSDNLFTTLNSNINWNGTMFNLVASQNLIVDSFDVKINSPGMQSVDIFTKSGSYLGFENSPAAWTLLGSVTVDVLNINDFTAVPIGNLNIPSGDTVGVYIQMTNPNSRLSYLSISTPQIRTTDELTIITGSGISNNFTGNYFPRDWNGKVYYHYGYRPLGDCATLREAVQAKVSQSELHIGADTIIDVADTIIFSAPAGFNYYEWFDGSHDTTAQVIAADLGQGIHYITLDVIDSLECALSDFLVLAIADLVSVEALGKSIVSLYPNPTNGIVRIDMPQIESLSVTTLNGELLLTKYKDNQLDLRSLANGMYLIKVTTASATYIAKVVKQSF